MMRLNKFSFFSKMFLFLGLALIPLVKTKSLMLSWKMFESKLTLEFMFLMDWMSLLFFSVLCMMVSCVLKFSVMYMEGETFPDRFLYMVLSFVLSMFFLIFFPNFFFLLMGWDGLGVTSFLLVIYYLSSSSLSAGMKTYLINRLGDSFFMVALALLFSQGHWDMTAFSNVGMVCCCMVMLGCFTKSAQFPFSSWLPAAMAAPTPVSALVHSSTLVTAGIYMLIRFCYIIPSSLFFLMGLCGLWTMYSASFAACLEWDAKKMVAYSTLSQLGFMVVAISLKMPLLAFFHLMTHALFKAMMFICVGYCMSFKNHFQDLRQLKSGQSYPLMNITLLISCMSLMGFPFLSGYFSKEAMIEGDLIFFNEMFHKLLMLSIPLTSFYSMRLVLKLINGKKIPVFNKKKDKNVKFMSLLPLYLGTMFVGNMLSTYFYSPNSLLPSGMMKVYMILLMSSGVMASMMGFSLKKTVFSWFFSEMSFIAPFKGNYWVNSAMEMGDSLYESLDMGSFTKKIYKMVTKSLATGNLVSNVYSFFLSPSMKIYLMGLFTMVTFSLMYTI